MMKCGVIRVDEMAVERMAVLRGLMDQGGIEAVQELVVAEDELVGQEALEKAAFADADVVFVAVPGAYATSLVTRALRFGKHVFVGRSALPAISECKALAALGEEAGVEIGISRLMRFHPFLELLPPAWRATSLSVHHDCVDHHPSHFQQTLEDAIDLCCHLAGTSEVRKIEAQLVQNDPTHPGSLMIGFRFQNGTYAQIQLRQGCVQARHVVYAGGGSFELEVDLINHLFFTRQPHDGERDTAENGKARFAFEQCSLPQTRLQQTSLVKKETTLFFEAIDNQKPVPVSILDGLQTLMLVEGIRNTLR